MAYLEYDISKCWHRLKTPLTLRHRHARFDWSHDHLGWTIRIWRRVHWSDESRFLLRLTDRHAMVWRQRNTSFQDNHMLGTTAFGCGGVTVWGCVSFDCKLDLYVLDGNLTGQKYRDNVLAPRVVPHFDNHALVDRPMFMNGNARPYRARIVLHFFTARGCSDNSMSPDMNPIEQSKSQNIDELRTAILQEWQQFPQERLWRLVRSMMRRVTELHNKRGGYTRY